MQSTHTNVKHSVTHADDSANTAGYYLNLRGTPFEWGSLGRERGRKWSGSVLTVEDEDNMIQPKS